MVKKTSSQVLILLLLAFSAKATIAAPLRLSFTHTVGDQPFQLDSLRYQNTAEERYSFTRLSYLITEITFETKEGEWLLASDSSAFIDANKRILDFDTELPPNKYRSLRFSIGLPPEANHSDPSQYPAKHPLNPDFNRLHWTWATGYIFMALEGRFYKNDKSLSGYVYHFANDPNKTVVNIPIQLEHERGSQLQLEFDLSKLLGFPSPISFQEDGNSTHSHTDDSIAQKLQQNLPSSFRLSSIQQVSTIRTTVRPKPIDLPSEQTPFPFKTSRTFPIPDLPTDNPLTVERVELGKKLFFDANLSLNKTISCASCHEPDKAFSDSRALSQGVSENLTRRHSMPLFNLAWKDEFFWDGRVSTLREQVFNPLQHPDEMGISIEELVVRLQSSPEYQQNFAKAFTPGEITPEHIALALENYLLSLTSYTSKFDQAAAGKASLSEQEKRGFELFMTEYEPRSGRYGADCFHCHGGALLTDNEFHNNGLAPSTDKGRNEFTGKRSDENKFSTPSLRNLSLTAPYMHDGRFATLEEVVEHYSTGIRQSDTLDPNLAKHPKAGLQLTIEDKAALVAFLKSL